MTATRGELQAVLEKKLEHVFTDLRSALTMAAELGDDVLESRIRTSMSLLANRANAFYYAFDADDRSPECRAADDAIREEVEREGTTLDNLPPEEKAALVEEARRRKNESLRLRAKDEHARSKGRILVRRPCRLCEPGIVCEECGGTSHVEDWMPFVLVANAESMPHLYMGFDPEDPGVRP